MEWTVSDSIEAQKKSSSENTESKEKVIQVANENHSFELFKNGEFFV